MRVIGYCIECGRIKRIKASGRDLVAGGVVRGVCDDCERKLRER